MYTNTHTHIFCAFMLTCVRVRLYVMKRYMTNNKVEKKVLHNLTYRRMIHMPLDFRENPLSRNANNNRHTNFVRHHSLHANQEATASNLIETLEYSE